MKLRLWRGEALGEWSDIPCHRGVYAEVDDPAPACPFEPEIGPGHGSAQMVDEGIYEFEEVS